MVSTQKAEAACITKPQSLVRRRRKLFIKLFTTQGEEKNSPRALSTHGVITDGVSQRDGCSRQFRQPEHSDHYHLHRGESFLPLCTCYSPLHKPGHWTLQSLKWIGHLHPRHYSLRQASQGRHKRQVLYCFAKFTTPTPIHLCNCQLDTHPYWLMPPPPPPQSLLFSVFATNCPLLEKQL